MGPQLLSSCICCDHLLGKLRDKLSSLLEGLSCLEYHQGHSCLPKVICTSAARQLEPNSDWSVIITQPPSWEMREEEADSVTNPSYSPQRSPVGSQPPTAGPRPEVSL